MKIHRFTNFINEDISDIKNLLSDDSNKQILDDIVEKIIKTVGDSDLKKINDFLDSFIKNSESTIIEGLVNDADVYNFYMKYRNQIDEILSEKDFYEKKPSEIECFSPYDYIIKATKESLKEFVTSIKNDISEGSNQGEEVSFD